MKLEAEIDEIQIIPKIIQVIKPILSYVQCICNMWCQMMCFRCLRKSFSKLQYELY